jgi:hypothetical protein
MNNKINKEKLVINDPLFKAFLTNKKDTVIVECTSEGNHIYSLFKDLKDQYDIYGRDGEYITLKGVKFIYVTTYSDYLNGELCGQENEYRISKRQIKQI